jgi:hypothetical protein
LRRPLALVFFCASLLLQALIARWVLHASFGGALVPLLALLAGLFFLVALAWTILFHDRVLKTLARDRLPHLVATPVAPEMLWPALLTVPVFAPLLLMLIPHLLVLTWEFVLHGLGPLFISGSESLPPFTTVLSTLFLAAFAIAWVASALMALSAYVSRRAIPPGGMVRLLAWEFVAGVYILATNCSLFVAAHLTTEWLLKSRILINDNSILLWLLGVILLFAPASLVFHLWIWKRNLTGLRSLDSWSLIRSYAGGEHASV